MVVKKPTPLPEQLRPLNLNDVVGQQHLIGEGKPLTRFIEKKQLYSMIFWGPPGSGKTSLAHILAQACHMPFVSLSAIFSGVGELKKIFEKAQNTFEEGHSTLLFVDEIHRFNRAQQDSFLPYVEKGIITLIGATTENPSFELNGALLSRCQVFRLHRLSAEDLEEIIRRAEVYLKHPLPLAEEARAFLIEMADGDGRMLLNFIEVISEEKSIKPFDSKELSILLTKRAPLYDKSQEGHYNLISAFHKSLRGSDPDAALYWFARMLEGGEDPLYIGRRMIRFASEDIGLADPQALVQVLAGVEAYERLGSPEGELALVQALVYLATAPKSNALYRAFPKALKEAQSSGSLMPPQHILNAPTKLMKSEGYGKGYIYDHDTPEGFSGQSYFPEKISRKSFYQPVERGFEREIQKRLVYWKKLRERK
ncbi:MAG: AAA family ATPase [Alphaproteobacteria bacterium GWC2_42_16]|nr:MAG: AAA family ATPase [Alphaproteobacteria bacterium GWC2_42_16]OFW73568.1 MAG: AAA family ATPase [Alphaproteobacteria bacterium GWA2_41_27]OFW82417.1 MAG: AAA family ATPase [Alphaproteobacteria bacterium RIFCSPHIGHO2_12_FULL_42_100]OFW86241.1 MAG: AAA family ATPase [Alphaproteobacteria bacterium RBG_16_42_14]OFW91801.1 MAG: AAA family ATPase [Alphaproteobacteria bacterium RIFCSPHIGHO2_02_FULL_42_30]OFW93382.1 MAG: AAA family ATPase [Alphaproteobacteria bacterium RIFCSPHIGHO2_12_42_13]OFX